MNARRAPQETQPWQYEPGDFGLFAGRWYVKTPNGNLGNLGRHDVTEHEDGTITVSPSILVSTTIAGQPHELWHGWLERGVWRAS